MLHAPSKLLATILQQVSAHSDVQINCTSALLVALQGVAKNAQQVKRG